MWRNGRYVFAGGQPTKLTSAFIDRTLRDW